MKIVEKPGFAIVGIEVLAPFEDLARDVPAAWAELFARADELPTRTSATFVEVSVEVRDGRYREIIGAMVDPFGTAPSGMTGVAYPAARYVHHRHEGPLSEIADTYGRIYDWGTAHGLRLDEFKVDEGYSLDAPGPHDLYVRLVE